MAGRARYHALKAELEFRTRKTFEDEPNATHLDYVCDWLENGKTAKELAAELSTLLEDDISSTRLTAYLTEAYGDTVSDRMWDARRKSAPSHAETAVALVDQEAADSVQVSRNRERARTRQWMAERYDSQRFGNQKQGVTINIGNLHLDALRAITAGHGRDETAHALTAGPASTHQVSPARLIMTQVGDGRGAADAILTPVKTVDSIEVDTLKATADEGAFASAVAATT